jgi:aspartate aminotransferase
MSLDLQIMLADKIQTMNESATIRMAQKSRDLAAKGVEVISLTLGEPDFDTPAFIKDAAYEGLGKGYTKYSPVPGLVELRKAIVSKFYRENKLTYTTDQIVVSNGAKQSIANICMSIIDPGDEVIIFAPYWVSYYEIVKFNDGTPIVIHGDISQNFKVTASQLESAITDKTRLIIFSSPCNPTGSVFSEVELRDIANVVLKYDNIIVISDEIYEHINFKKEGHFSIAQVSGMAERTAVVNGFSKAFSMTGWRLGYMAAPQWLASACNKVQGQITSGAASFSQYAATKALEADHTEIDKMVTAFQSRRDLVYQLLKEIPGMKVNYPEGAFYFFPNISHFFGKSNGNITINDADDFCEMLLTEAHVGTVSGVAFGDPNCFRLSYAASDEDLKKAIQKIKNVLSSFH